MATNNNQLDTANTAIGVTSGGTGLSSTTTSQLLYSSGTSVIAGLATANNGVLITSGAGVPSISSTIPSATQDNITRLGTIATGVWNGTAVTVGYGGTGIATTTAYSVICAGTTSTGAFQSLSSVGTSGQVLTSNGAAALPTWQAAGGGGNSVVDQTTTPQTIAATTSYIADKTTLITFNMPASMAIGNITEIIGYNTGGWLIQMNTGQTANFNTTSTTSAGSLASTNRYNSIRLMCVVANTTWVVMGASGVITVA
jgi:hypothetical protein